MEKLNLPKAERSEIYDRNPSIETLARLIDFLEEKTLESEIEAGNITLVMIRPELVDTTTNIEGDDAERAQKIEEMIQELEVMVRFGVNLDEQAYEEFYAGAPHEAMLKCPPLRSKCHNSRWEEFRETHICGPSTVLILYSPNGDACQKMRNQIGHRDIENRRDPNTIRGKIGIDNYSTIIHSSEKKSEVKQEKDVIKNCLERRAFSVLES